LRLGVEELAGDRLGVAGRADIRLLEDRRPIRVHALLVVLDEALQIGDVAVELLPAASQSGELLFEMVDACLLRVRQVCELRLQFTPFLLERADALLTGVDGLTNRFEIRTGLA
jgi:hypothetical protein